MLKITESCSLELQEKIVKATICATQPITLTLSTKQDSALYLQVEEASEITIQGEIHHGCTLLIWNQSENAVHFTEQYTVREMGSLKIAYGEINQADSEHESKVFLQGDYAKCEMKSATLCRQNKKFRLFSEHHAPYSEALMENYGVVVEGGHYTMDCTGSVLKGAVRSKSHQSSHALTFDSNIDAIIQPNLLIDENDVEASHATSVGQVDEDQLFYLQSRGLTYQEVIQLITIGYLLPIANFIDEEELRVELQQQIESKAKQLCSM